MVDESTLQQLADKYNWWMGFATILVAVGILGEYIVHFMFDKEARRGKLQVFSTILFGIFVFGGVVGEYLAGSKLSEVAGRIQRAADAEAASLNRKAADASAAAEKARKEADSYELEIAEANQQAAEANERTAKLEAVVSWRGFSQTQHDKFVRTMEAARPGFSSTVWLESVLGHLEAKSFANQIYLAISQAGIPTTGAPGLSSCATCFGVWICVNQNAARSVSQDANMLRQALEAAGVQAIQNCIDPANTQGSKIINIIVGPKQ